MSPLTGQAKEKGKTIKDSVMSFPTALLKENVFPPRTGVDPTPKLHGPAAETRDWYSFRHTLKNVSHSSRVHFLSAAFRVPSQHRPFCSSPLALCIDRIWISNLPVPSDTCGETQRWAQRKLWSVQVWGRAQAAVHPCAWLNRVTSAAHGSRFTYLEEEAEEKGGSHRAPSPNHASGLLSPLVCTSLLAGTRHHSSPLVYACTSGETTLSQEAEHGSHRRPVPRAPHGRSARLLSRLSDSVHLFLRKVYAEAMRLPIPPLTDWLLVGAGVQLHKFREGSRRAPGLNIHETRPSFLIRTITAKAEDLKKSWGEKIV